MENKKEQPKHNLHGWRRKLFLSMPAFTVGLPLLGIYAYHQKFDSTMVLVTLTGIILFINRMLAIRSLDK